MKIEVYSPTIRRKEMDAVLTALVEDMIGPGEQAKLLIQIAREKLEFDYCIALRSPAIALSLALKSLGLQAGQGVVLSALSPSYYLNVLNDLGLVSVYADVPPESANISRETIEKALQSKPENIDARAVVLHHNLGYIPDTASINELGIPVIEDRSQSFGGRDGGIADKPAGIHAGNSAENVSGRNCGVLTIMGLEERDMLTAGGGALLYAMNRRDASVLRNLGDLPPEYGLPDMNAAMGVAQFRSSAKNLERRREIAAAYSNAARRTRHKCFVQDDIPLQDDEQGVSLNGGAAGDISRGGLPQDGLSPGEMPQDNASAYNNYVFSLILESGVKDVKAYARRKDIIVESAFENTIAGSGIIPMEQCPQACSLALRTVLFPLYPRLRKEEIEKVSKLIITLP